MLDEIGRIAETGCDDLLLPCSGGLEQVGMLAEALSDTGWEA